MNNKLSRLLVALVTAALCVTIAYMMRYSKTPDSSVGSEANAAAPIPARPHLPAAYGINVYTPAYWGNERSFMNLAAGGGWRSVVNNKWSELDPKRLSLAGFPAMIAPDEDIALGLTKPPAAHRQDVRIHCQFEGRGEVDGLDMADRQNGVNFIDFTWKPTSEVVHFVIKSTDPANPIRALDCREANADPKRVFDPLFVESVRPFKVVRFMDWQKANGNLPADWGRRTLPVAISQDSPYGVAVEHMVALANEAGVDPWFVMPWNATTDYMDRFARYVHDNVDPQRSVYVEIGNEVWNPGFPVAQQAINEGLKAGLSTDRDEARMRRYAQRSVEGFQSWEKAFADNPRRLVRVLAGQNVWPALFRHAIDYRDTARHVDAISSALYFGIDTLDDPNMPTADLGPIFAKLNISMDETFRQAGEFKKIADQKGLRYIGYEAGQHMLYEGQDPNVTKRLSRDPRMADVYRRFLGEWKRQFGDLLVLYTSVSQPYKETHFGLAEYSGQPLSETPKRRAVLEVLAAEKR